MACSNLSFMCLGIDIESPANVRRHRNSLFVGESENLALREEISENVLARQRIYSEQVFDQSQTQETVGYQSSKSLDYLWLTAIWFRVLALHNSADHRCVQSNDVQASCRKSSLRGARAH